MLLDLGKKVERNDLNFGNEFHSKTMRLAQTILKEWSRLQRMDLIENLKSCQFHIDYIQIEEIVIHNYMIASKCITNNLLKSIFKTMRCVALKSPEKLKDTFDDEVNLINFVELIIFRYNKQLENTLDEYFKLKNLPQKVRYIENSSDILHNILIMEYKYYISFMKCNFTNFKQFVTKSNYEITNVFGRYLLMPVQMIYGIEGNCKNKPGSGFKRAYCAPLLEALRLYVIGNERYDSINNYLVRKIKAFTKSEYVSKAICAEIFKSPQIQTYFSHQIRQLHSKLNTYEKKDAFVRGVNRIADFAESGPRFDQRELSKVLESWSRFIAGLQKHDSPWN